MALEVFAGPIVRRADEKCVVIWIVLKRPGQIQAQVFGPNGGQPIGSGFSTPIKIGELFVHLVEAKPTNGGSFLRGVPLGYSIVLMEGAHSDDTEFLAWAKASAITYGGERPSVVIQPAGGELRIATGSCRKIHDKGVDALSLVDDGIVKDPAKRPHVLLLTGDQIYADDVDGTSVLPAVTKLSQALGLIEMLPPRGATHTISIKDRKNVVKAAGFTSGEADHHLLSFGEFVAMYGLVWNPDNWKGFQASGEAASFLATLPKVRRLLANVATYMIFDDHDVTDDWFIHNGWKADVLAKPAGRRIVSNALAAYFLMQGWGNDPSRFGKTIANIKAVIEARALNFAENAAAADFDKCFDGQQWEYATPTEPICYALDSRTRRGGGRFPPILKDDASWRDSDIQVANKNMPFVLIAPAPVFNLTKIEFLQRTYGLMSDAAKLEKDFEGWSAHSGSLFGLFDKLLGLAINKVVIVSGDVHYSYSVLFKVRDAESIRGKPAGRLLDGLQITASALKNGGMSAASKTIVGVETTHWVLIRRDKDEPRVIGIKDVIWKDNSLFHVENDFLHNGTLREFEAHEFPDLMIRVSANTLAPKTAPTLEKHNFANVVIRQNLVKYNFNDGTPYAVNI